jgi:hypothetical protein
MKQLSSVILLLSVISLSSTAQYRATYLETWMENDSLYSFQVNVYTHSDSVHLDWTVYIFGDGDEPLVQQVQNIGAASISATTYELHGFYGTSSAIANAPLLLLDNGQNPKITNLNLAVIRSSHTELNLQVDPNNGP